MIYQFYKQIEMLEEYKAKIEIFGITALDTLKKTYFKTEVINHVQLMDIEIQNVINYY